MKHVHDNEIRAEVRSLLVRQRVDQWRLQVRVSGGMLRITGDLVFLRGSDPTPPSLVEGLERALSSTQGVKHATLDVSNWRKPSGGEWKLIEERAPALAVAA
ncbi:MAG: hypothetical protein HOP15_06220 [Planctomycetes bacterium]|nr:hypothetical protein [Planctomycetota bacterium]